MTHRYALPKRGARLLLIGLLSLNACASRVGSSCDLLTLQEYGAEANWQLGNEVMMAEPGSVWVTYIGDYITLRDEVRACRGKP